MTDSNGSVPNFTHTLLPFELEGITFRRRKIRASDWADTLARVGLGEREAIAARDRLEFPAEDADATGPTGPTVAVRQRQLFAVSAEGLYELCRLGVHDDDVEKFVGLWEKGLLEFGELSALRDWMWEQMTARPFTSATPSSDGPGNSTEASSRDESSSPAGAPTS